MAFFDEEIDKLSKRNPPKSLKECLQPDALSQQLWEWAKNIETWGRIVFGIILICGSIVTISIAMDFDFALSFINPVQAILNSIVEIYDEDEKTVLTISAVISSALVWGIGAFIEYCIYHVISLILCSLASIVQSNRITSDIAAYDI